ncbi:MAG TPA: ACT domain-containing protein, partial [Frankiaceae bacterium]|nr:ACT domain-containing protein [Frankiaceae bacterium]
VDRHLVETAAGAAALIRRVDRPDLLLLGAFLHDVGKGWPGDHVVAGVAAVERIGPGLGLTPADVATLVALVRHHLLLPEVATRRDLADPATAERVAEAVRTPRVLGLLHALTEADSLATGPTAWSPWKARLVAELVERAGAVLGGGPPPCPPVLTAVQRELLARTDGVHVLTRPLRDEEHEVVVTAPDRVGLLAAATGVLALHRLDVRRAQARSADGRALIELAVAAPHGESPEPARLRAGLVAVAEGRCDLATRLARREQAYTSARRGPVPAPPRVRFDDAGGATVVEVRAPDGVGVLHRIVRTLSEAGLDVRTAIVATLGLDVVDTFYVRGPDGAPVRGGAARAAIADAVLAALTRPVDGGG